MFRLATVVAGIASVMYTPLLLSNYHMSMDFIVLSFVVVVVGGMGSLLGAVAAGFLLGILQSLITDRTRRHSQFITSLSRLLPLWCATKATPLQPDHQASHGEFNARVISAGKTAGLAISSDIHGVGGTNTMAQMTEPSGILNRGQRSGADDGNDCAHNETVKLR